MNQNWVHGYSLFSKRSVFPAPPCTGAGWGPEDRGGEGGAPKLHYRVCFNLTVFNLF